MHFEEANYQSYLWADDMSGMSQRFRKDAIMLQPATGWVTCRECNASYESETKLRDHQRMSHRGGDIDEGQMAAASVVQPEDPHV
jgi:hypothetical protein